MGCRGDATEQPWVIVSDMAIIVIRTFRRRFVVICAEERLCAVPKRLGAGIRMDAGPYGDGGVSHIRHRHGGPDQSLLPSS